MRLESRIGLECEWRLTSNRVNRHGWVPARSCSLVFAGEQHVEFKIVSPRSRRAAGGGSDSPGKGCLR